MAVFSSEPIDIQAHKVSAHTTPSLLRWSRRFAHYMKGEDYEYVSRTILDEVTAYIPSERLTAILGSSGSGKTTLLNVLARRDLESNVRFSGYVTYNGLQNPKNVHVAYVTQQDTLPHNLSVREALRYAAELRSVWESAHQRDSVVEGKEDKKGCSGGEKRRISIAVQLLTGASILFCDEPTSGLDSATALQVVQTLKNLAADGSLLYEGPRAAICQHFERCGYTIPEFFNPAEFLVDIAATKTVTHDLKVQFLTSRECMPNYWGHSHREITPVVYRKVPSVRTRCKILTKRTMTMCIRDIQSLIGIGCAVMALAAINGWIFWQLDESQRGIRSRQGSLWDATGLYGYLLMITEICRLVEDIQLFDHERKERIINPFIFLLSRRVVKLALEGLTLPTLFTVIYYPMVGYRANVTQIFIFWLTIVFTHSVAIGVATLCVSISRNFYAAGLMGNLYFALQTAASGYFMHANQLPSYVRWLKWLTPTFYTFTTLCANEFVGMNGSKQGYLYDCPFDIQDPRCKVYSGVSIMKTLGLPYDRIWKQFVILCAVTAIAHCAAVLTLHLNPIKAHGGQSERAMKPGRPSEGRKRHYISPEHRAILTLHDYCLQLRRSHLRTWRRAELVSPIVGPLTSAFRPGCLNIVMGASGSGKTSLLASLAGRLPRSINSSWVATGSILYNGMQVQAQRLRSLVSYVPQDDQSLLPGLTVHETLLYAAELRLASSTSPNERARRVEETITKFGLEACANTVVGSGLANGISGGERRRLSIACKVLTHPHVIVLDEPTSGLDSFSAGLVINFLHNLSSEGCTVILSIHQPTSSMWPLFSTCLLLTRDGLPVFSGETSSMLSYFSQAGHNCPSTMNPADFFVDLVSTYAPWGESNSMEEGRVEFLLSHWKWYQSNTLLIDHTDEHSEMSCSHTSQRTRTHFSFIFTVRILLHRAGLNMIRSPLSLFVRLAQCPGIGLIWTIFTAPLQKDIHSVQTRMGYIQQYGPLAFIGIVYTLPMSANKMTNRLRSIGMIQNVATFPSEQKLFYLESSEHLYGPAAFLTQYTMLELPFEIVAATLFSLLVAYASQLGPTATEFGVCLLSAIYVLNSGESLSMIACTISRNVGIAVNLTSVLLAVFTILGGTMSLDPPRPLQWLNYLSPIKHAIASVSYFCLHGLILDCSDVQLAKGDACPLQRGEDILELYRLNTERPWWVILEGFLVMLGYRLLAYVILKIKARGTSST
ncbi:hypothetical protein AARAC_006524 [Aspergillus arachidicola]|uniref:ABC transporter domain-containing protein n=1 Tax=Aspergillus arachidicola TaxID=656916 RepID=A0A2G7FJG2_9EURO|nr:hypothetical protein AARAC_006524 [Aspergillus arachidicola]